MTIPLPRRRHRLAALAAMAVALPLTGAATSQAAWLDFDCSLRPGTSCTAVPHALRAVSAYSPTGRMVGAGATTSTTSSSWVGVGWDEQYACVYLDGSRMLYPVVANGAYVSMTVQGTAEYGSQVSGC